MTPTTLSFRGPEGRGIWAGDRTDAEAPPPRSLATLGMTDARQKARFGHILPTMDSRRAMRFSIGGWVANSEVMPPPENGLAIIMCAVVGWAVTIGTRWVYASS